MLILHNLYNQDHLCKSGKNECAYKKWQQSIQHYTALFWCILAVNEVIAT